ncbi:hypothetical protein PG984_012305 [Apiospora sp. TS-2023a]
MASSSYNPTPSPSAPSSGATPPSSPPPSSAPTPTLAKGSQGSSRVVKVNPSNIYQVDDNEGVHEWVEYIASLHYRGDSLFGALRGTVSDRYSTIKANTARRDRRRYLEEEQIRVLLVVADEKHQEACDACDSDKISPDCLLKRDVKLVKHGLGEIMRYREFYRPDELSKHIAVAILGFKPRATDFVPRTLRVLFEASSAPVEGWDDLVTSWDLKFQQVRGLPKFIQHSVAEARTKLSEAAWLIRRFRGEEDGLTNFSWKRDPQLKTMEQLLCRMTQMAFDDLADQYLKQLGVEALECLKDGDNDKVLVYSSGSWPKKDFKDIHSYYKTNSGFPRPAPLDLGRLETFQRAALCIIDNEEAAQDIRSQVTRILFEEKFLQKGDDKDDDTRATTPAAADEELLPPPASEPGPSSQPEAPKKKRGRPPKKQGDPKAPYRKKQKPDRPANSQPSETAS